MISLAVNELIRTSEDGKPPIVERVLWIDAGNKQIVTIEIFSPKAFPLVRDAGIILEQLEEGKLDKFTEDPYGIIIPEDSINETYKQIREKAWERIGRAVTDEPGIYRKHIRGRYIREIMNAYGTTKRVVYKLFRRYWQRGKVKNALLPDYLNSGGRGKAKNLADKKIGRPRQIGEHKGVNVNDTEKKYFSIAFNKYFLNNDRKNPLQFAYDMMIKDFYDRINEVVDGKIITSRLPIELIPTFRQFRYWCANQIGKNPRKVLESREGKKIFELKHRAILGKSETGQIGPGSIYQIDSTIGDIFLVSGFDKSRLIGRPVIYIVVDVFSRMITGMYVGLEGPSWEGSMMALYNAASSKVAYCKEYGIDIKEEDWPCSNLPETLLADRGEIESKNIEMLINTMNVRVDNTPPYRADLKGIVERFFRTLHSNIKPFVPGYVNKKKDGREPNCPDYRLNAKLNLRQFTEILIFLVLHHNNQVWMDNYSRDEMMISDNLEPIPIKLWRWGIANRSGLLHSVNENILKLNLMPSGTATVTKEGIKFKNMYYSCDEAMTEQWFERARNDETWNVDISYDKRNMNYIYIRENSGKNYIPCFLLEGRGYKNKSLMEIEEQERFEKEEKYKNSGAAKLGLIDFYSKIEEIVNREKDASCGQEHSSKSSRIKGIRENRAMEKMINRKEEYFDLNEKPKGPQLLDRTAPSEEEAADPDEEIVNIDYLRKKQRERLNRI